MGREIYRNSSYERDTAVLIAYHYGPGGSPFIPVGTLERVIEFYDRNGINIGNTEPSASRYFGENRFIGWIGEICASPNPKETFLRLMHKLLNVRSPEDAQKVPDHLDQTFYSENPGANPKTSQHELTNSP